MYKLPQPIQSILFRPCYLPLCIGYLSPFSLSCLGHVSSLMYKLPQPIQSILFMPCYLPLCIGYLSPFSLSCLGPCYLPSCIGYLSPFSLSCLGHVIFPHVQVTLAHLVYPVQAMLSSLVYKLPQPIQSILLRPCYLPSCIRYLSPFSLSCLGHVIFPYVQVTLAHLVYPVQAMLSSLMYKLPQPIQSILFMPCYLPLCIGYLSPFSLSCLGHVIFPYLKTTLAHLVYPVQAMLASLMYKLPQPIQSILLRRCYLPSCISYLSPFSLSCLGHVIFPRV